MYSTDDTKTNNYTEVWHSRIKHVVRKAYPNMFECVEVFQKEQGATKILLLQRLSGAPPPCRTKR